MSQFISFHKHDPTNYSSGPYQFQRDGNAELNFLKCRPPKGKAVSFIELLVAHSSVLTIMAISVERYYAVCYPLEANSKCTLRRALIVIIVIWLSSLVSCLPMLKITKLITERYIDGSEVDVCVNTLDIAWRRGYYVTMIVLFFAVPLVILVLMYISMSRRLIKDSRALSSTNQYRRQIQVRKQVVIMVASVCVTFFVCLFPFRYMPLWIVYSEPSEIRNFGVEPFYNLLFFCRVLIYLNSASNPILYNLISSKFRKAFCRTLSSTCSSSAASVTLQLTTTGGNTATDISPTWTRTSPTNLSANCGHKQYSGVPVTSANGTPIPSRSHRILRFCVPHPRTRGHRRKHVTFHNIKFDMSR